MNQLTQEKRVAVISALVEGNSIRATVRMTGVAKNTVVNLLTEVGVACDLFQDEVFHALPCKRIQCDEIWGFVGMKQKTARAKGRKDVGDIWVWTAICADTKLVPCWRVGGRDAETAAFFIDDLAKRLK